MLSVGELFIPAGLRAAHEPCAPLDLIVHLHGAPEVLAENLPQAGAVLVTVSLNGLSTAYAEQFTRADRFLNLLDEASRETAAAGAASLPFRRVILSSFSAGFGGVRELLKSEACYQRIHGLVMADSIYAGYKNDDEDLGIDSKLMAGFVRFARDAQAGRKRMVVSYCRLPTERQRHRHDRSGLPGLRRYECHGGTHRLGG